MPGLLKKLEVNGFKSFGQKTVFDFSGGITAIVGPNGSGKSNVIDAVRWLLGEREAKNLRGAKAEDLIFAGTSKRPRMSMAQASLFFDNKNKFFPAEFAEISVSRQVSRDGTNQYFLNKSEVRLKDLVDFFAKARLGTKGMIVVTQGNSDLFIRVTPTERREMIEEMLGLREYQIKKSEAEKRLKNTQINLDKVRALSDEILPHLRSLKRQTSRWEKRDVMAQELKDLENRFFGLELHELDRRLSEVEKDISGRNERLQVLLENRKNAEANLKGVEASQPEERKEIEIIKSETQKLLEKRSQLQKELGRLEARMEMEQRVEPQRHGSVDLLALVKRIQAKLKDMSNLSPDALKASVQGLLEDINNSLEEKSQVPQQKKELSPELRAEFAKIGQDLQEIEMTISSLKEKERALEKNQEQFYQAFKAAVGALETAKDAIEKWESATQSLAFEKERLQFRKSEWERQVRQAGREPGEFATITGENMAPGERDEAERRIFRLRGDLASIGEIDEALIKEANETETRYEFLSRESSDLEKAKEDLRALIGELNEKIKKEFGGALGKINEEFGKFFALMFGGGTAKLKLQSQKPKEKAVSEADASEAPQAEIKDAVHIEEEEFEEGIDIDLKLPKKRITSLGMLSGGERSLVGIAALFAMISVSPPPFLVLDEVDAPLDEKNARRFSEMLREFSKKTQFILVTHNRATMEAADVLYGVTIGEDDASKVVSLRLEK